MLPKRPVRQHRGPAVQEPPGPFAGEAVSLLSGTTIDAAHGVGGDEQLIGFHRVWDEFGARIVVKAAGKGLGTMAKAGHAIERDRLRPEILCMAARTPCFPQPFAEFPPLQTTPDAA
jgi:hypothetical protein